MTWIVFQITHGDSPTGLIARVHSQHDDEATAKYCAGSLNASCPDGEWFAVSGPWVDMPESLKGLQ